MVERYRRGKGKQKLLGSHQKCWIWGRNLVLETLQAGKWRILELILADTLAHEEEHQAAELARRQEIPLKREPSDRLKQLCKSGEHQGYLAKMPPYPYDDAGEILSRGVNNPFYVILDSIQDPYNFGAILRSAEGMAADAVFIRKKRQVEITSLVARTSAGAAGRLRIARVPDLCELIGELRSRGVSLIAATRQADHSIDECDLRGPLAVVIGNEGSGISDELLNFCDRKARIPQYGRLGSLNAAVAAGIIFYEVRRQRSSATAP